MCKILVVADKPGGADRIERYLAAQGYQTSHARRGEDALARMAMERPDLVLLDWDLPQMSGSAVCRAMQRDACLMGIPVLALAASATPRERQLAYAAGAADYMTQPCDLEELADHIGAQLYYCDHQQTSVRTGLPTGPAVRAALTQCLAYPQEYPAIIYVDIDHLDEYNETYSFIEGNGLIQRTAAILQEALTQSGSVGTFLGYVGAGEFVIITESGQGKALITEATARYIAVISSLFYPEAACRQGYMMAPGHDGQLHQCPLTALSFDVVDLLGAGTVNGAGVPLFERPYRR